MSLVRQTRPEKLRLDEAIRRFQATLDTPYLTKFNALQNGAAPKPSDVFRLTEEVDRDGHKVHRTWRQYGSRLQKALDQIVVFTKIGDILVGGSQNMIACGVWAAVRLSIQVTAWPSFVSLRITQLTRLILRSLLDISVSLTKCPISGCGSDGHARSRKNLSSCFRNPASCRP